MRPLITRLMNHPLGAALTLAVAVATLYAYSYWIAPYDLPFGWTLGMPWWVSPTIATVAGAIIATAQALRGRAAPIVDMNGRPVGVGDTLIWEAYNRQARTFTIVATVVSRVTPDRVYHRGPTIPVEAYATAEEMRFYISQAWPSPSSDLSHYAQQIRAALDAAYPGRRSKLETDQ